MSRAAVLVTALLLSLVLERGVEYMIAGVCDDDCSDLALTDRQGNTLATDERGDDVPSSNSSPTLPMTSSGSA
jgi:hypothetical protein